LIMLVNNQDYPNDLEKITKIFCRLLANWIYKYENCVYQKSTEIWNTMTTEDGSKFELYENGRYKFIESEKAKKKGKSSYSK